MFTVTVEGGFTASHALVTGRGDREPRHSHAWKVRVAVSAETLDESGLAVDFLLIRHMIAEITGPWQGAELESLPCFKGKNVSAERVAVYVYEQIAARLTGRVVVEHVKIMEAEGCWVKYSAERVCSGAIPSAGR